MVRSRTKVEGDENPATPILVGIVITCDNVYLPLDGKGNGRTDWQSAADTTKVARRARLKAPPSLAEFLSKRDQAEIV